MKTRGYLGLSLFILLAACSPSAKKLFTKAKAHYEMAEYEVGIQKFQQAKTKGYDSKECAYYIAECYRRSNRIHESEKFYQEAVNANTTEEEAYFYLAKAMKSNGNYKGAESAYKKYLSIGTNFDLINKAKAELNNLKQIENIVDRGSYYEIFNINELNTPEAEYSPFMHDGKLYFTSSRGADKMHLATMTGFTDLYEYTFDGTTKFSGQSKRLHEALNTEDAHEATCVFTKDGKTMYFSRGNTGSKKGQQDVDIFVTTRQPDGTWTEPVMLPFCEDKSWDSCPALSPDGRTLYFASNREGGRGGTDIYKASVDASGNWTPAVNLGSPINSSGNDMFPYVSSSGAFYFSSDGHPSLGGIDLFEVVKKDGKNTIVNMGPPLNSSYDDFAMFYRDTTLGFMTSNRPNGKGDDDIYEFVLKKPVVVTLLDLTSYFNFSNTDTSKTRLELTTVKLINEKGDTIKTYTTDKSGMKSDTLSPGKYRLVGTKDGYLTGLSEFTIDKVPAENLKPGINTFRKSAEVVLQKIADSIVFTYNNILYDYDKADIRPDAEVELNKILEILQNNPSITIELGSHTDERGSDRYNQALAQKRAQSAVNYLISKGIKTERMVAKGYGESTPVVKNASTEEEHQRNRRTTFRITNAEQLKVKFVNVGNEKN
ncbi:MAG: OmpA family protein [Cytophagaceae bacterium]|jgi:peptidoglycan-associated lipoprotein|nr:OmpA family protein [Cytophagaceae bacterium]